MKRVVQEDASGCGVAALAMLLDLDYSAARDLADAVLGPGRNWASQGLHREELDRCLLSRDCELEHRREPRWKIWPPAPFAPRHYAYAEMHFVAVEANGDVLDTWERGRTGTMLAEWADVKVVVGVWR
jgi:hypothetical protein